MELQMKSLMAMLLCKRNYYNPASDSCENKLDKVYSEIKELNIYDILEPSYHGPESKITTDTARLPQSFRKLGETERPLPVRTRMFGHAWPLRAPLRDGIVPTWPQLLNSRSVPCSPSSLTPAGSCRYNSSLGSSLILWIT